MPNQFLGICRERQDANPGQVNREAVEDGVSKRPGIIGILESTLVFQVRPNPLTPYIASAQVCDGMAFSEQIPEHVGAYSCEDAVRRFRIRISHPVETAQTISYHPNFMPVNGVNHRTGRHTVLRMACGLFV